MQDGEVFQIGDIRIEAIMVPGHTWGHMVYLIDDAYLFTGDTIWFGPDGGYSFINSLAEDNELAKRSLAKLEKLLRERGLSPKIITGHTGWSQDLDFSFAHRDKVCNSLKKQKPHDPTAPYDGYDESDDTEEGARNIPLVSVNEHIIQPEVDGFYGVYYPNKTPSDKAMIIMLGDSSSDRLAVSGAKWVHGLGCHALAMSPDKKDYGHHNYPIERFGSAIKFLKDRGIKKIGIAGASTTGMLALVAASYYPDITLTIAMSPSDFIMEGFYRDGKDGMTERPGDNESTVTWKGEPLPYLPYAYRHPEYWKKIKEEAKAGKDMAASRKMFDESERRHPIQEEEKIKVENIKGQIVFIGAEDDVLWDTCKYIRRMEERLSEKQHDSKFLSLIYEHGTHFVFPESMLKTLLPVGADLMTLVFKAGREYSKECKAVREDIDIKLREVISEW